MSKEAERNERAQSQDQGNRDSAGNDNQPEALSEGQALERQALQQKQRDGSITEEERKRLSKIEEKVKLE